MAWDRDSLWSKASLFFEKAFDESKDDPLFGLWSALGLELLARSALAHVSPTLLAEPDKDHRYLLHALNIGSERVPRKSLSSAQVLSLCSKLFDQFAEEDKSLCLAIINRRNEELHSGSAAFAEYPSSQWLSGFYCACKALCEAQNYTLEDLFGVEEAQFALELISSKKKETRGAVESKIAAHRKVFEGRSDEDQKSAKIQASQWSNTQSWYGGHKSSCPACGASAVIEGEPYGQEKVSHEDNVVVVRQPVNPRTFKCTACNLELNGYAELEAAGMGGRYTSKSAYSPEEYFGLVDPENMEADYEYNNE